MDEREYSHRLGKRKTGYLYELTVAANTHDGAKPQGEQPMGKTEGRLYDDLSIPDAGLTEMWMEMRM